MPEIPFRLRFFVLGAQKCATSWLYYCLRDHPDVVLPASKIEHGYIGGATYRERGADWYFARYPEARPEALRGEVAVDYLLDGAVPAILGDFAEDPRFVVMLRHPVDRLVSAYYWSVRRSQLPNLPLEEAIAPLLDEEPGFPRRFADRYFDELVRRGFYGEQLAAYSRVFGADRFLVVGYPEVAADPLRVVRRVYAHIGVDPEFVPPSLTLTPKKNSYSRLALSFERLSKGWNLGRIADRANRLLSRVRPGNPGLSDTSRARLCELFAPRIAETERALAELPESQRPPDGLVAAWRSERRAPSLT
jgi:hypothetical protein